MTNLNYVSDMDIIKDVVNHMNTNEMSSPDKSSSRLGMNKMFYGQEGNGNNDAASMISKVSSIRSGVYTTDGKCNDKLRQCLKIW